jgi:creatinine amidohydrolase/Fe(II)-dependent formamide hydrolase-like protein
MFLERMKTADLDISKKYTFVISMGATEQHGPFLPLGTDSYIQDVIIQQVEKELPEVIFLPTLRITCSQEHAGFPGSVWIKKDTMEIVLRDICESLRPYAANIILASWHGGNISMLNRFVEKNSDLLSGTHIEHLQFDSEEVLKKTSEMLGGPVDEHAGNSETSMMLVCEPSLVTIPPQDYPKQKIENAWDTDRLVDVSKDGIVDNHPTWIINEEIGKQCIQMAAEELILGLQKIFKTK